MVIHVAEPPEQSLRRRIGVGPARQDVESAGEKVMMLVDCSIDLNLRPIRGVTTTDGETESMIPTGRDGSPRSMALLRGRWRIACVVETARLKGQRPRKE